MSKRKLKVARREAGQGDIAAWSDGHVAFYGTRTVKVGREKQTITGRIDEGEEVQPGDTEYFVGPSGLSLWRAPVTNRIRPTLIQFEKKHGKVNVRADAHSINACGVDQIIEFCRRMRFGIPEATRKKKSHYERMADQACASTSRENARRRLESGLELDPEGGESRPGGRRNMANRTADGRTLAEAWVEKFKENEVLAKKGKAKTDAQLVAEMRQLFPKKKGVKSIEKIERQRLLFNEGIRRFKKFGPARPKSNRYEDGKTPLGPSGRRVKAKAEKKQKAAAKKVAKPKAKPVVQKKAAPAKRRLVIKKSKPAPASAPAKQEVKKDAEA